MNKNFDYKKSGVDLEKSDEIKSKLIEIVRSTHRDEVVDNKDGYGGLFNTRTFKKDSLLVSTTDSVGTKVKISSRMNLHRNLGIDIVNHCVNDLIPQGALPLYFLDYLAFGELNEEVVMIGLPAHEQWRNRKGVELIGPKHFGFDFEYIPIEDLQ